MKLNIDNKTKIKYNTKMRNKIEDIIKILKEDEKICELSNLDIISVRPHNIYGPRMGYSHVIPEMIKKLNSKNILGIL